ncbi:DNA repair protein RecO [Stagnimonas aquatica]|uniref:DNA repair protein RecO n=1 Tax=Stagnimonas aquatica TaxID=2689987 RepID=A0A3N0V080_9GAMM|nr:DNA repair protein RecO [Stagnimonas aquatica]ROH85954.1 DNA repair protein RecO [Stagnimonas aquatica]
MQSRRVELQPAYLLHTRGYGDTSLLIEAFTPEYGRVGLIAKGARGPRSKTRAYLQPLQPLLLSWSARGELGTVTGIEAQGQPVPLAGEAMFCAWYANELLMRLCAREDPHPILFAAYVSLLPRLREDREPALRAFECRLLDELGYGLRLPADLEPGLRYRYDWERGPLPVGEDGEEVFAGSSLIALREDRLRGAGQLQDARRLLRQALHRQLAGKPLQTALLLRQLRQLESAGSSGLAAVAPPATDAKP